MSVSQPDYSNPFRKDAEQDVLALNVVGALAVGGALTLTGAVALAAATALAFVGTTTNGFDIAANSLTTGQGFKVASSATALATTGRLFLSSHSGATSTSGVLNEFATAANDETILLKLTASDVLATGNCLAISAALMTTGKGVAMTDLDALTSGIGLHIASGATAITGTGRLVYVNHTGATGTSATLFEIASAANDETIIFKVTASAALATGKAVQISGAAITTGTALDVPNLDLLTTGTGINLVSNAPSTGTRVLCNIVNDNTAAVGTTCLTLQNDATAGAHMKFTGTGILGIDFTGLDGTNDSPFDFTAGTGCTAAPQTNAPTGFVRVKVGGTFQWIPYYNAT